ncbi:MAG: hypothetical protein AB7U41_02945, partial [Dongiaceae bacterium]
MRLDQPSAPDISAGLTPQVASLEELIARALTPGIHINAEEKRALNHALGRRNLALKNQGVEPAGRAHGD